MAHKVLPVPYFSQLDNRYNPNGACNVTSVAMVLWHLGIRGDGSERQLEDQLYRLMQEKGWSRHSPYDLQKLIHFKGRKDTFKPDATWEEVDAWLDSGKPVIFHGFFTRFGHIVTGIGRNDQGYVIHDPNGEFFYDHQSGGRWYDQRKSGEALTYSYKLMRDVCGRNGDLWVHFCG
jgi:hypothetical protein